MKTSFPALPVSTRFCAFAVLLGAAPLLADDTPAKTATEAGREAASQAAERVENYREEASDLNKAEVKAALAGLDAEIEHLETLADHAPDDAQRQAVRIRIDALKERRDAIKSDFNQARFAELKADVRREWNEFKAWVHDKTDDADRVADAPRDTRDTGNYAAMPETAAAPVATNRDSSYSADTRERQRVALERVDRELDRLEDRADRLDGDAEERLEDRIELLQARRDDLKKNFSDESYTRLMQDILSEADRIPQVAE